MLCRGCLLSMLWSPDLILLVRTALGHGASSFSLLLSKIAREMPWDPSHCQFDLGTWWLKRGQGKVEVPWQCCHAQSQGDVSTVLLTAWVAHAVATKIYFLLFLLLDSDFCFILKLHCAQVHICFYSCCLSLTQILLCKLMTLDENQCNPLPLQDFCLIQSKFRIGKDLLYHRIYHLNGCNWEWREGAPSMIYKRDFGPHQQGKLQGHIAKKMDQSSQAFM